MARRISRPLIVDAALATLDDGGIDAVTVRAVAQRLGVQAPALYYHVPSKQRLLDEMGTEITRRVIASLQAHPSTGDWLADLSAYGHALRSEYLLHRDGARTFSGTLITDADVVRAQEPWLRRWVESGVPRDSAFDAIEIVTAFVTGSVIEEQERAQSDPSRYGAEERAARLGDGVPLVVESGYARADADGRFDRQLATVIAGLGVGAGSGR
jgi:TetR/AcrR family transcriptional regulator, tetracycline repressor protein